MNWDTVNLSGDPLVLFVLRDSRGVPFGARVDVDRNTHSALAEVAENTLALIKSSRRVPYTPYIAREEGTYLTIGPTSLVPKERPKRRARKTDDPDPGTSLEVQNAAAMVHLVENADYLQGMGAGALLDMPEDSFYAQAIVLRDGDRRVGFITKSNPRKVFRRSAIAFARSKDNQRFERIAEPEIALEENVDVVVHPDEIAILNELHFRLLASDTRLIEQHMPGRIKHVANAFASLGAPLSDDAQAALLEKAKTSPQFARRVDALEDRIARMSVTRITGGGGFTDSALDPSDFIEDGEIVCDSSRVGDLLDALEGRLWGDPFSDEWRRAQAWSLKR